MSLKWRGLLIASLIVAFAGLIGVKNIFQMTDLDTIYLNTNKGYVENRILGKISYNKATFFLNRYLTNFFAGTDPNYFFFGGHPRETAGWSNQRRISYWLIPFFFLGLYQLLTEKRKELLLLYGWGLFVISWFSIETLWWVLTPFWYLPVIYPLKDLWKR